MTPDNPLEADALTAAREFIAASRWQFAKRMKFIPHEYTMRKWAKTWVDFEAMVLRIREHGYDEPFGKPEKGRVFTYLEVDGWRYWTMGAPLEDTILINRAQVGDDGKPLYGPAWLTGRKADDDPECCALGKATGGEFHAVDCEKVVLTLV